MDPAGLFSLPPDSSPRAPQPVRAVGEQGRISKLEGHSADTGNLSWTETRSDSIGTRARSKSSARAAALQYHPAIEPPPAGCSAGPCLRLNDQHDEWRLFPRAKAACRMRSCRLYPRIGQPRL